MPLSDAKIRALKPAEKTRKIADEKGLYIEVTPRGSRLWRVAYRFHGKQRVHAIGPYPDHSLKDARAQRDEVRQQLAKGQDPAQQKRLKAIEDATSQDTTFSVVAAELLDKRRLEGAAAGTLEQIERMHKLAAPFIGKRPISEITAPEILIALRSVERRGRLETAKRLRGAIGRVFRYAISTSRAMTDPTFALQGALATPRTKHRAAILEPKRFGGLLRAIDGYDGQPTTQAALKLMSLLFPRPGELRQAEWSEIDFENALWTIPAERMKMRVVHVVPLSRQALEILRDLHVITGGGALLFPGFGMSGGVGRKVAPKPMSENTLGSALRRLGYGKEEASAHGFRASASTLLNASRRFEPDWIEVALAHMPADKIRGIYNRNFYIEERREMMQWWADECDRLRDGGQIVALKRKARA